MFNANKLFFDENNLSFEQFKGCRCALKSEVKLKYFPFSFFTTLMLSTCRGGGAASGHIKDRLELLAFLADFT